MAKFSDFYGRRRIYVIDLLLFGVGSAIISMSMSIEMIYIGRIIQGVGAGGIFPVASAFIGDYFPIDKRGFALGIIGAMWGISAFCGPVLGAILIPYGWHWCFTINIPISIALIAASFVILPELDVSKNLDIDWAGTALLVILATILAYGVNQIDSANFIGSVMSMSVLPFLLLFVVIMPIFIRVEKRAAESIVPIHMFKNREITNGCILMVLQGIFNSTSIFIPSLAMLSLGLSTQMASLMMLPGVITSTIFAPILGKLLDKMGYKILMSVGSIALVIGMLMTGYLSHNPFTLIGGGMLVGAGILCLVGAPMRFLVICETSQGERGTGQGLINMLGSAGQLIGGALIGGLIASYNNTIFGYEITFALVAVLALVAFIVTRRLKSREESLATMMANS